jgi:hypothetical protein
VDALFIEALRTPEQMDAACARFAHRVPLLANMVEGGKTPVQTRPTSWARAAFASSSSPAARRARWRTRCRAYASLKTSGSTAENPLARPHARLRRPEWRPRLIGTPRQLLDAPFANDGDGGRPLPANALRALAGTARVVRSSSAGRLMAFAEGECL